MRTAALENLNKTKPTNNLQMTINCTLKLASTVNTEKALQMLEDKLSLILCFSV